MNEGSGRRSLTLLSLGRAFAIVLAGVIVALPAFLWLGPPTSERLYKGNELTRFAPTWGHGLVQLGGETLISILVVYAARRWFRVRL
ncbi:MAG TPA: hypothetical protein VGP80_01765 [Gemmatimonadales bacterium]|jgi:hypothetical protein|nr:hypothetical protein [Gemmatimonadales bacterium]